MSDIGFQFAPVGLIISKDRIIDDCNQKFCQMFGYSKQQLVDASLSILYPSVEEFHHIGERGLKIMQETRDYQNERIMKRRDGHLFWCRVRGHSLTPQAPFSHAIWSFADMSNARPIFELSARERQVATLMAGGHTAKEIARLIGISNRTVEAHRANLFEKLEVRNTAECVAKLVGLPTSL